MEGGGALFIVFIFIMLGIILMDMEREAKARRKCTELASSVRIEGGTLVLPEKTRLLKGTLRIRGEWIGAKHRHYSVQRELRTAGEFTSDRIELKPERFFVSIRENDDAWVELPVYVIVEGKFRDALISPVLPTYRIEAGETSIGTSHNDEYAHLRLETGRGMLSGRLYTSVEKCRGARVELIHSESKGKEKLVEVRGSGEKDFERRFWEKPLILVMDRNVSDPRKLREAFGARRILEGHGKYEVLLTMDVPLKQDEHAGTELLIEPAEGFPEGSPEINVVV
ncbi:hypothetical protein GQS_07410 [Thermococcus sp. 4557]|uniref:hypothetical protein n=1 Tax=Thermococcus sp. (strain CGMCC 1.5172 / 4557) TaxID=1042877 RepID=UPI000219EB71|nr:hypothetical protein [Thermococcus sp. 4557]AEK73380.1 hypothetical protein GQS_07410 [Thermococcus sp. 4557]